MNNIFNNNNCDCNCDSNFDPADFLDPDNSAYRRLREDYPGYFNHSQSQPRQPQKVSIDWKPLPLKKLIKGFIIFTAVGFSSTIIGVVVSLLMQLF